jgi:hypothetical protein
MSVQGSACWECGELAPSGVCTRPHPSYSHGGARLDRNITDTRTPVKDACTGVALFQGNSTGYPAKYPVVIRYARELAS